MNRLSPLIVRRSGPFAPALAYAVPGPSMVVSTRQFDDLKLFATAWICGLVFFGTMFA